jgi:multiple sugar transport system permease protein
MMYYAVAVVPLTLAASLFAAVILNQKLKGENFFRTAFYIPSLMPEISLIVIWTWILNPTYGLLNQGLKLIGITGPVAPHRNGRSFFTINGRLGALADRYVDLLSTLQSVPQELYEVCDLDGGSPLPKFGTLPSHDLPAILFNLIMQDHRCI